MKRIDAHQHFWIYDPIRDSWIDDSMAIIQKDFMPEDLYPILSKNNIDACVAVQADQSEFETNFLLDLARENDFIKGVVGWADLRAADLKERLEQYSNNQLLKGIRHIAQSEGDNFLTRKDVMNGIKLLKNYNLTYDILIYEHQLPAAINLARSLPEQKFVLDHMAKPQISIGIDEAWVKNIKELAKSSNVFCKLSGLVTETKNFKWKETEFKPFLEIVLHAFGIDRVIYGSDWPVCNVAAKYEEQLSIISDYMTTFSYEEQEKVMGTNAVKFYNLK